MVVGGGWAVVVCSVVMVVGGGRLRTRPCIALRLASCCGLLSSTRTWGRVCAGSLSLERGMMDGCVFTSAPYRAVFTKTMDYTVAMFILLLDYSIIVLLYYRSFVV